MQKVFPDWMYSRVDQNSEQRCANLNDAFIPCAEGPDVALAHDRPRSVHATEGAFVEAIFQNLEGRLVQEIMAAEAVVGCMAWLTNQRVLQALAFKRFVSMLVQKEDWLRPDSADWSKRNMYSLYCALPVGSRWTLPGVALNTFSDDTLGPVRCVGVSGERKAAMPRMHHKFIVFCRLEKPSDWHNGLSLVPYAVWTGSFNATHNGTNSFENAVVIKSQEISQAYLAEFTSLVSISEPLNWESEWIMPEYRIGT